MLLGVILSLLLLAQMVSSANPSYRDLKELLNLLEVEKQTDRRGTAEDMGDFIQVCSQEPIELALVIDSSVSIDKRDFLKGQQFLADFLETYDIGPGKTQVRVAAVTFGRGVYVDNAFNLNTYKTKQEVLDHVARMRFRYGDRTDTGDALHFMRTMLMRRTRPWAPKIAIVLTDGNSQRATYTRDKALEAKADNITVFAVGVGRAVKESELLNIAGGRPEQVIRSESYSDLNKDVRDKLAYKTCVLKPRPTTTPMPTTTPPAAEPCSQEFPSDINFIFSPASLGLDSTGWVTQFISHTITNEELQSGFQYGVVSGDCPDEEGFTLGELSEVTTIKRRLARYDRNNLPVLVRKAAVDAFSPTHGARPRAGRIAVIFLGPAKVDQVELRDAIKQLQYEDVNVFVATTEPGISVSLPQGVRLLEHGSSISQASEFVNRICHLDRES